MAARTVVVFTDQFDISADAVIVVLHARGVPVFRCDPAEFPTSLAMRAQFDGGWSGWLRTSVRSLNLSEVGCAWWRRPSPVTVGQDVPERRWAAREADAGLRGLLACLPWLNDPDDIRAAEHKPRQLATAARVGLTVPATLLTNDAATARAFVREQQTVLYKPLTATVLDSGKVIYASLVDPDRLDDGVRLTAHLFQRAVPKAYELRVTAVDGRMFTARLDIDTTAGRVDWRADYPNVRYHRDELPAPVAGMLRAYMARMRLRFAAFDLIVTPAGEHVFLEANPNGQWAWIEEATGLPIAAAIADALEGTTR